MWSGFPTRVENILEAVLYPSIFLPYIMYAWAYKWPHSYLKVFSQKAFEVIGIAFKWVSNIIEAYFCLTRGFHTLGACIGIPLFVVGQILNAAVYKRLGKVRTYYGYEFGLVPMQILRGFPFQFYHAQYKGSMLSGFSLFLTFKESRPLIISTMLWLVCYMFIINVENGPCGKRLK